jgi:alkylation response protein AidB-like acyl-CoA dehydrogenase
MTGTVVDRELPSTEAVDLLELTRELANNELRPRADKSEAAGSYPRELIGQLGELGLLSLPYPERFGGGGQPAVVYLQVLEELARGWCTIALSVSVHVLSCSGVAEFGTPEQQDRFLPEMLGGRTLGAYCLSEPHAGSDAGAMRTRAVRQGSEPSSTETTGTEASGTATAATGTAGNETAGTQAPAAGRADPGTTGGDYVITGDKAWITNGSIADFMLVAARTSDDGARGISTFLVPTSAAGVTAGIPERKMGFRASPTCQMHFDGVRVRPDRRIGAEGQGFRIAMAALDGGRLGISACAVGLAQAALDVAADYAAHRVAFGRTVDEFQGVSFLLADAAAQIAAARQLYLYAARRRDAGKSFSTEAAMAKVTATDMAMRVTTDMVQVLGGAGYVEDYPLERYMREAKVLQIVEGTNQIQRMVIARSLKPSAGRP